MKISKKASSENIFRTFIKVCKNQTAQFISGIIIVFFAFFLTLSLVSFLSAGKNDATIIEQYQQAKQQYQTNKRDKPLNINDNKKEYKKKLAAYNEKIGAECKELKKIQKKVENHGGFRGAMAAQWLINDWLGLAAFFLVAFLYVLGVRFAGFRKLTLWKAFLFLVFLTFWFSVFFALTLDKLLTGSFIKFGGNSGKVILDWLESNVNFLGTILLITASMLIFLIVSFSGTIPFLQNIFVKTLNFKLKFPHINIKRKNNANNNDFEENIIPEQSVKIGEIVPDEWFEDAKNSKIEIIENSVKKEKSVKFESIEIKDEDELEMEIVGNEVSTDNIENFEKTANYVENLPPYEPQKDLSNYKFPDISLLKKYEQQDNTATDAEKTSNRKRIVETLQKFGIGIKKIYETIGPTITLYEIVPDDGIRINKIRNLADDIMLSLAAIGIRIIAPIPGKGTIGIEVPNSNPRIVSMYDTIASKKFQDSAYDLPVALGRTITNEVFMFDLCKMPHLLVAGATGQGKSVGLNAIITSLLYKKHPAELKFVLIDPKKVEFNIYADIEHHFLAKLSDADEPVITDTQKVVQTLNSLCKEMDLRYDLLKIAHARNIKEYNEKFISRHLNPEKGHRFLPYIVVIVDEFGDLIMTAGKEVEMPIARIAQLARAVGMHMIIATQRPSVNIITGVIKANFPARVAFKVSSGVDSKTILDGSGAQQLIGRGDLLFSQGNEPARVQCAFVDTPEVENIVHFIGDQTGYPTAFALPEPDIAENNFEAGSLDIGKRDSMFDEVAHLVVATQMASASNIQRKFSIGFNRAARLIDQLEAAGVVGAPDGSKPRQVMIQTEYDLEKILK
jgi:S-DNA-T family DNA segregation ATPase FtsK/SpoIIIE